MIAILVIAFLFLLVSHLQLRDRVTDLEKGVTRNNFTEPKSDSPKSLSEIPKPDFSPVAIPPAPRPLPNVGFAPLEVHEHEQLLKAQSSKETDELLLVSWFKEHTLIKIGGLFFFLGAAWFVSYAIEKGWLSPELRIALGFALALATYALAWYRSKIEVTQYLVLTALGTGIVCATVSAAQVVFQMFSPVFALALLAFSIGYTVFVAFETKVSWLTILSGVLGLLVPLLIGSVAEPLWLLLYLLVLTAGLIFVGLKMEIRSLTLIMLAGVTCYQTIIATDNSIADVTLWLFVVVFSLLFFASITRSLTVSAKPQAIDVTTFGILAVSYVAFASELTKEPSIAIFMATFVIGAMGYLLAERNFPLKVVAVFIAGAGAGVLVGTSFLFSESELILAYIAEITAAFLVATYLGLPSRVISVVAFTYLLPLLGSLIFFVSSDWEAGIWHSSALVIYSMCSSLFLSALWLIHQPTVAVHKYGQTLASTFGTLAFFYAYAVVAVVAGSLFNDPEALVITYIMWAIISLSYIYYLLRLKSSVNLMVYATSSLTIPVMFSLPSFASSAWEDGLRHPDGFGVLSILLVLFLTTLTITQRFCKDYDAVLRRVVGNLIMVTVIYLFTFFYVFWHGLLDSRVLATVAIYSSYAWVLYGLTSLFVLLRANINWIGTSISALALPIIMSLSSFNLGGWNEGVLSAEPVGLFGLVAVFVLLAMGLRRHYSSENNEDEKNVLAWSKLLFGLAFVYSVGLVWSISHTVADGAGAVSLALFVYTVLGLLSYLYGKRIKKPDFKYAGVSLLVIVILHIVLIDIWEMEIVWRVVTLLVIGSLFIVTALFDRDKS
ncbi:MAG: DUF2339 domain-containing protein [Candidatus Paceibacterota bacterium]